MILRPSHPPGHFYSPVIDPAQLTEKESTIWNETCENLGIDFNDASHKKLLLEMEAYLAKYDYPEKPEKKCTIERFYTQNSQFSKLDARALFVFLQLWEPKRVIEVGSGYSSLLIADVNNRFLNNTIEFTCIEPYPRDFLQRTHAGLGEVVLDKVENIPLETFQELEKNDILFIDSSHVSKTGSDVNYLVFEVLPRLKAGVIIHFHDIFLPNEYPKKWVLGEQRSWNEQYLVRALLMYSNTFRIIFSCTYAYLAFPEWVKAALNLPGQIGLGGGSLWLEKTSPSV